MHQTPTDHWPQLLFELRAVQLGHLGQLLPQRQSESHPVRYRWACSCDANDVDHDHSAAIHPDLALQRWAQHVIADQAAHAPIG